jgi:hypothetical protein
MTAARSKQSPVTWSFERGSEEVFRIGVKTVLLSTANIQDLGIS